MCFAVAAERISVLLQISPSHILKLGLVDTQKGTPTAQPCGCPCSGPVPTTWGPRSRVLRMLKPTDVFEETDHFQEHKLSPVVDRAFEAAVTPACFSQ